MEEIVLHYKYIRYHHKTNTDVFIILSTVEQAKFYFLSTICFGDLFVLFIL